MSRKSEQDLLRMLADLSGAEEITPTQIIKTVTSAGTPEVLAAAGTVFRTATLIGIKAARTNNVGDVYVGIGGTNDTQIYKIAPGSRHELTVPPGEKYDLNDWYCDVLNNGDGIGIIYS